ncbi:MAG: TylF/MycF/NovP-related O-methyltransferase [Candidatus Paceibacterota bacterium]
MTDSNILSAIKKNTMLGSITFNNIIKQVKYVIKNGVEGDYVECGVWKGGGAAIAAKTFLDNKSVRCMHLFDVFDDPPMPTVHDDEKLVKKLGGIRTGECKSIKGCYARMGKSGPGTENGARNLIINKVGYCEKNVQFYKGWFQDTVPAAKEGINKISVFVLDCGYYDASVVCLENLYEKLEGKGIMIVDNYFTYSGCRKAVDEYLNKIGEKPNMVRVNKDCVCWHRHRI